MAPDSPASRSRRSPLIPSVLPIRALSSPRRGQARIGGRAVSIAALLALAVGVVGAGPARAGTSLSGVPHPDAGAKTAPPVAGAGQEELPVSDFVPRPAVAPALQARLDASMARLEALSRALRAAIGDMDTYAPLRLEHDAQLEIHRALTDEANGVPLTTGTAS